MVGSKKVQYIWRTRVSSWTLSKFGARTLIATFVTDNRSFSARFAPYIWYCLLGRHLRQGFCIGCLSALLEDLLCRLLFLQFLLLLIVQKAPNQSRPLLNSNVRKWNFTLAGKYTAPSSNTDWFWSGDAVTKLRWTLLCLQLFTGSQLLLLITWQM